MAEHVRPPFVLVFASDLQGCGFHRCAIPLVSLVQNGMAEGRLDLAQWPADMIQAAAPDVIVFQRYVEDGQIEAIKNARKAMPDALFVFELDDYLGEIPKASFHAGFMPPNLSERIKTAMALCDRVTVSTEPLAEWFRDDLGAKDVRVIGNAVPMAAIRPREGRAKDGGRLRVGFAGGISHAGDLEIIRPAMQAIGEEVEWVFFGTQPKNPPVRVEFHPGVPPSEYQAHMMKLDLDLVLAPLEDNRFNRCKSNLRLIEAGMIGASVIAQRLEPYTQGKPPAFAFADAPDEWTAAIRSFMATTQAERTDAAARLQNWVMNNHTLEKRLKERVEGWLKVDEDIFEPRPAVSPRKEDVVLSLAKDVEPPRWARNMTRKFGLVDAAKRAVSTGADLLWLRPGTTLNQGSWDALRAALAQADGIAAALPLASDGPNAFPRKDHWTLVSAETTSAMNEVLAKQMRNRRLSVAALSGPVALLGARALALMGLPDVDGCDGNEEQALFEWSLRAGMKGFRVMQAADAFASAVMPPMVPTQKAGQRLQIRGYMQLLQGGPGEALSDRERVTAEMEFLKLQWAGPQPGTMGFGHDYAAWADLKGDLPAPVLTGKSILFPADFTGRVNFTGTQYEWVVFTDDTVEWKANGFRQLEKACQDAAEHVEVIYADHDIRSADGGRYPDMKPDFDLEMFLARDYITPICAVRIKSLLHDVTDKHSLYAEILRIAEESPRGAIQHLPMFLVTVPEISSPEELAVDAIGRQMVVEEYYQGNVAVRAHHIPGALSVVRKWQPLLMHDGSAEAPLISIVVPTLGGGRLIQPCVNTIRQHTKYPNFEILVVQNGPRAEPELNQESLDDPRVRVVRYDASGPFNWSAINNWAVREHAKGEYLCFVNDDIANGSEDWLDNMLGHAVRPDVGAVGARLIHPAGFVQHVGVIAHKGIAGHLYKGSQNGNPGNGWLAALTHEMNAVTAACMMVSRAAFDRVDGFDEENFPLNYSDTDFCLKLRKIGLRNVVEMTAELLHPEGTSRSNPADQEGMVRRLQADNARFAAKWPDPDPYWHPDLALGLAQGGMAIPGLDRTQLNWPPKAADPAAERVLLINDMPGQAGRALEYVKKGAIPLGADASGLVLRLVAPIPANLGGWDVRNAADMASDLKHLGITKIVLRSLVGSGGAAAPVEVLRCLAATGIPVEADPIDPALLTPWLSDKGVLPVFGAIGASDWKAAYETLFGAPAETAEAAD
jgi:GT2 family glycosyltransferase